MSTPLVSVLVPTKNRPEFIAKLLDCYKHFSDDDGIEFIFHENISDSSNLFKGLNKEIYRHIHIPENLSMSGNFSGAISSARGKYVLITGDDDFILPEIIGVAQYLQRHNILAAVSPQVSYLWPGVGSKIGGKNPNGKTLFHPFHKTITYHETSKGLKKILDLGGAFFNYEIPSIYQGIVERELILKINEEYGTCFPGFSPDLSSAIAISTKIKTFIKWSKPFVVSGASPGSGAAEGYSHIHNGSLADRKYIVDEIESWPPMVPKFFSGQTIYSASTYISINIFHPSKSSLINYEALYAGLLAFNFRETFSHLKSYTNIMSWPKIIFFLFIFTCQRINKYIYNFIYNLILPKLRKEPLVNTPEKAFIEISKKYKMFQ